MLKDFSLLIVCGILFCTIGIQSTMLSSLSPELSDFYGISPTWIELLYPASWVLSFAGTICFYNFMWRLLPIWFYWYAAFVVHGISAVLLAGTFLFKEWISEAVVVCCIALSSLAFGYVSVTLRMSMEIMMNNYFSKSNVYDNNGVWSVVLGFSYVGWMLPYAVFPLFFVISPETIPYLCAVLFLTTLFGGLYLKISFGKFLVIQRRERSILPEQQDVSFYSLMMMHALTSGLWFSLLLFLPQNTTIVGIFSQEVIVFSMLGGVLCAAAAWYFMTDQRHWFRITSIGIFICVGGALLFVFSPDDPLILSLSVLLMCLGSGGFYSSSYVAAVNLFKGDNIRITFVWLAAVSSLTIVVYSEILTLASASFPQLGLECGFAFAALAMIVSLRSVSVVGKALKKVPALEFGRNTRVALDLEASELYHQAFEQVPEEEHELDEGVDSLVIMDEPAA